MSKFEDFSVSRDVGDIMERLVEAFPRVFSGFNVDDIGFVFTKKKEYRRALRLHTVGYPRGVFCHKVYIVEAFQKVWDTLSPKQRNLAVFHIMCAIPDGGFDPQSSNYGKKKRPDYELYRAEFAVSGGIPDWQENEAARDPMEVAEENKREAGDVERSPVTADNVADAGSPAASSSDPAFESEPEPAEAVA